MKEAWVRLRDWSKKIVTAALESGADGLTAPEGLQEKIKALGRILTVSPDGDLKPGVDAFFEPLRSPADEARISALPVHARVFILDDESDGDDAGRARPKARPWEVIPLENLVARGSRLIVPVGSPEDVDLALGVLETGVAGVLVNARSPAEVKKLVARVKAFSRRESLSEAVIASVRQVGMGDRVCVDTCTIMREGQGLLVGNSSGFLFLVQAEALENPYVAPRPFRVNAGPVSAYVRVPEERTRYLSELKAGDAALVVDSLGEAREAVIGRVKIERRPLVLIEADCGGVKGSIILQNAETIRLTAPDGKAKSVAEISPGDVVLVSVERAGRHFGMKVEETVWEK